MATEEDVAAGLVDWINSFEVKDPIHAVGDLNDGETIWKILQQIDGFSFSGPLPEPPAPSSPGSPSSADKNWVRKWNNLKHLYDALSIFLVAECDQRLPLFAASSGGRSNPDLKAIAQHSSLPDTILLLKLCVVAAINCADRIEFLKRMQELGERTQEVLMNTAQEAGEGGDETVNEVEEEVDRRESIVSNEMDTSTAYSPTAPVGIESALASEERLGKVIADNQRIALEKREIQRQLDELYRRFESLQQKNDRTQEQLNETNERLTAVLSGKVDGAQSKVVDQKTETVIATLESRVLEAEGEVDELRKTNEVLKIKADRVQKLQDDYDEIKIERDKLSRKANTAEKYRQKLESIQDMEKENQTLKAKVGELQAQVKQSDSSRASSSSLQREVDEYRRLLPSIEQERYDLNEMKKRLEFDYHTLEARYYDVNEQLTRSQNQVEDLQGRLRDYEDGGTPGTPPPKRDPNDEPRDWEKEEADFLEAEARLTAALLESSNNVHDRDKDKEDDDDHKEGDREDSEEKITEDELRAIMSAMRAQAQAGTASEKETGIRTQKRLLIAIEKQRSKNLSLAEHIKKQSDLIAQMRETIDREAEAKQRLEENHPDETVKTKDVAVLDQSEPTAAVAATATTAPEREILMRQMLEMNENLKREIRLMTSAWYEQNQRMTSSGAVASNAVTLMRSKMGGGGIEEPKSFLGRQRRVVNSIVLGNNATKGLR